MVTIGTDALPGTITTVDSTDNVGRVLTAPAVPVLVGQAYLSEGNANADEVYRISRASRASSLFGPSDKSMLTHALHGALTEGASVVYAVAATEQDVSGEDLSGASGTGHTLANAPVVENAEDVTFTINSTTKDTVLYYDGDPSNASPGSDEVYLNPQTGKFEADESLGNTGDEADYSYADYTDTFDQIDTATILDGDTYLRSVADFIAVVDENNGPVTDAKDKSESMEQEGWFNIAVGGAGEPYIVDKETNTDDTASYSNPFDTSRAQLVYPTRDSDDNTIIGEYVGVRAQLGIDEIPMFSRFSSVTSLHTTLSRSEQENLVNAYVNPLEPRRASVRIVDDLTTVSDSNAEGAAWRRGFARLVTDYVTERADERAEPFVGDFNERSVLNALRGNVSSDLKDLYESGQIEGYSLVVEKSDSLNAILDIGIETAKPLRNIEITVTAGDVAGSATGGTN